MDNVITINNTKENTLEFEMSIEGLPAKDVAARFVIETKLMELTFAAKHEKKDVWSVTIPELPMLERTAYTFSIVVVADGYHFKPMSGTVNVVGTHEIYTSKPKNITLEPEKGSDNKSKNEKQGNKKKSVKEYATTPQPKKREKSIEQIARELMETKKLDPKKIEEKVEQVKKKAGGINPNSDDKIHAILESVGLATKKAEVRKHRLGLISEEELAMREEKRVQRETPATSTENSKEEKVEPKKISRIETKMPSEDVREDFSDVEEIANKILEAKKTKSQTKKDDTEDKKTQQHYKDINEVVQDIDFKKPRKKDAPDEVADKVKEAIKEVKEASKSVASDKVVEQKSEHQTPKVDEKKDGPAIEEVLSVADKNKNKVIAVLESVGIQPKSKKRKRFSLTN